MTEHELVRPLLEILRKNLPRSFLVLKHADMSNSGYPDISVNGYGRTTWWEVKVARPKVKWKNELQRIRINQMAVASYCRLIVYEIFSNDREYTNIVHPDKVDEKGLFEAEYVEIGIDHGFVLSVIRGLHVSDRDTTRSLFTV